MAVGDKPTWCLASPNGRCRAPPTQPRQAPMVPGAAHLQRAACSARLPRGSSANSGGDSTGTGMGWCCRHLGGSSSSTAALTGSRPGPGAGSSWGLTHMAWPKGSASPPCSWPQLSKAGGSILQPGAPQSRAGSCRGAQPALPCLGWDLLQAGTALAGTCLWNQCHQYPWGRVLPVGPVLSDTA